MDLALAIQVAQNRYLRERTQSCPEDRLELLRRFMDSAKDLQGQIQGPAAGGPVPMSQAQAGAAGLPPPVPPVIGQGAAGGAPPGPLPSALPMAQAA
jgi:hypothetical protein